MSPTLVAATDDVPPDGSYLFTVRDPDDGLTEVILVSLRDGVAAWKNGCRHEPDQRLDRGDDRLICPKHGSTFDVESGDCEDGPARGTTLVEVDVAVRHGQVYLTDDELEYVHDGGIDDNGDPSATSHLRF